MATIKSVSTLIVDGDWIESKDQSPEGIRLIQTGNIGIGEYLDKTNRAKYISEETFERLKCTELVEGDVLVSRLPDPIGRACIVPKNVGRAVTAVDCTIIRLDPNKCDTEFFVQYTQSDLYQTRLAQFFAGSTRTRISRKNLEQIEIPLPDIAEQRCVASILGKVDELIILRKEQLAKLDQLVKSRFIELFGDPKHSDKYGTRKLSSCVANKADMVDGPFGSQVNTKVDYIENGEIPVIRTVNVKMMQFSADDLKFMSREKYETVIRSQVLPGDVVLTKVGTIGNVCIFPDNYQEAVLSTTGSCRIRVDESVVNKVFFAYNLMYLKDKLLEIASTGVQPFLNMNHIKNIDVLDVPLEQQALFTVFIEQTDKTKLLIQQSLDKLETLKKSLMQEYFG